MKTHFACVAEAVAYLYLKGYKTIDSGINYRLMVCGNDYREITKTGFLSAEITDAN